MTIAVTPGAYAAIITFERTNGTTFSQTRGVVAFDDHGMPLVLGHESLRAPYDLGIGTVKDWYVEEARPLVAAQPGWYALFAERFDNDEPDDPPELVRRPVIAWRPSTSEYGGSATIIDYSLSDDGPRPVDAAALAAASSHLELLGFFHDRWFPPASDPIGASRGFGTVGDHQPEPLAAADGDEP
jgi:hypothetical protein